MNRKYIFALAIGLAVALGWSWRSHHGRWRTALDHRELATRVLARYLAEHHPRAKALVIGNPFTQRAGQSREIYSFEKAGLRGLREGFRGAIPMQVVYPELRPECATNPAAVYVDPETTTPLSFLVAENAFDELAGRHPDCELLVSLIGLPLGLRQTQIWRDPEKPRLALLLPDWRFIGNREEIRQAFRARKIAAAVVNRPGAPNEHATALADEKAEFERRFILITPENIDGIVETLSR